VVVPFPDRRSRSSKRRREIVVYLDDWTDTPLAALRKSLCCAFGADQADQAKTNARLGAVLEDLSQRFDCHFIVLLDRFEDLLQAPSDEAAIARFVNELAEAINQPQLAANFLIALAEEAKPRLAGLRTRIPGFDDSSLKLSPPRDFDTVRAPVRHQEPAGPTVVEALPVLNQTVTVSDRVPVPAPPAGLGSMIQAPAKRKFKQPPFRLEIRTEDVYAMIESSLARIAMARAVDPIDRFTKDRLPDGMQLPAKPSSAFRAPTNGKNLQEAIEKMERRLGGARERWKDSES